MGVQLTNEKGASLPPPLTKCAFSGAAGKRTDSFSSRANRGFTKGLKGMERGPGCCFCFSDTTLLLEHMGVWLEIARKPVPKGQQTL